MLTENAIFKNDRDIGFEWFDDMDSNSKPEKQTCSDVSTEDKRALGVFKIYVDHFLPYYYHLPTSS